ncbi:MAG: GtrA family protein [Eubacteriales bacterium]
MIEKNKLYRKICENKFFGKLFSREIISYFFFGVLATVVSIGSYAVFLWLCEKNGWLAGNSQGVMDMIAKHSWLKYVPNLSESLQVFAANLISWVCAVAFAFFTNKLFVFKSKSWKVGVASKELVSFVGARIFSLVAETLVIIIMVSALSTNEITAKVAGQIVVLILNYILSKIFVFKKQS